MKWLAVVLVLLVFAAGGEGWVLRERKEAICHFTQALARNAPRVATWLEEAAAEPFLGDGALRGPPNGVIAFYRSRARSLTAELAAPWLLPKPAFASLETFVSVPVGKPLTSALGQLPAAAAAFPCREPAPANAAPEAELDRDVADADRFWAERKSHVLRDKMEFAHDREIYCKANQILARLDQVAAAAARRCSHAKRGSKLAGACATPSGAVNAEKEDVEKERRLNERKLRQKWPAAVIAGLRC